MNLSGNPGIVHPMQIPPTFGQPPIPAIHPRFGLPAAEQGLLLARALLDEVGGVRPLPVLAELDLARRLGRQRLAGLATPATTTAVRWRRDGTWRRGIRELGCLAMHCLRLPPATIARLHG